MTVRGGVRAGGGQGLGDLSGKMVWVKERLGTKNEGAGRWSLSVPSMLKRRSRVMSGWN